MGLYDKIRSFFGYQSAPVPGPYFGDGVCRLGVVADYASVTKLEGTKIALQCISEGVGALPMYLYKLEGRDRTYVRGLPQAAVIESPNPDDPPTIFWTTFVYNVKLYGFGLAVLEKDRLGNVVSMRNVLTAPSRCEVKLSQNGTRYFSVTDENGYTRDYLGDEVFYVPDAEYDRRPISIVTTNADTFTQALHLEALADAIFANGMLPGTILQTKDAIKAPEARQKILETYTAFQGAKNAGKVWLADNGLDPKNVGLNPVELQLAEQRLALKISILALFQVPLAIGNIPGQTYQNTEAQGLQFIKHCLRPIMEKIEEEAERKLLLKAQRGLYEYKIDDGELLRGLQEAIDKSLATGRQWGWYSANDACEILGRNGIGPQGDVYISPLNMGPPVPQGDTQGRSLIDAYEKAIEVEQGAALKRVIELEAQAPAPVPEWRSSLPAGLVAMIDAWKPEAPSPAVDQVAALTKVLEALGARLDAIEAKAPAALPEPSQAVDQVQAELPAAELVPEPAQAIAEEAPAVDQVAEVLAPVEAAAPSPEPRAALMGIVARKLAEQWESNRNHEAFLAEAVAWLEEKRGMVLEYLPAEEEASAFLKETTDELGKAVFMGSIKDTLTAWEGKAHG